VHREAGPTAGGLDGLGAVVVDAGAEHAMPPLEPPYGRLQAIGVDIAAIELVVEVCAHAPERLAVGPPDPVGVLHGGEVEGLTLGEGRHRRLGQRLVEPVGQEGPPLAHSTQLGQVGERDLGARLAPAAGQAHHPE
jgi:hypothetical protein